MKVFLAEQPFSSIQGEGETLGSPSVFVRFYGCNLSCRFCDSKFSWENKDNRIETDTADIAKYIMDTGIDNVVFTGGEPLLYQAAIDVIVTELEYLGYKGHFEIETNGSINLQGAFQDFLHMYRARVILNISPKFNETGIIGGDTILETLRFLDNFEICDILKFVDEETNRNQIVDFIQKNNISEQIVYVMPECTTREEHLKKADSTIEFCKENNFNFSPRLHILLWDKTQGV